VPGLDATYELFSRLYGTEALNYMMNVIEYAPHRNPEWDPYAVVFNVSYRCTLVYVCVVVANWSQVTGSEGNATEPDCVAPVPLAARG